MFNPFEDYNGIMNIEENIFKRYNPDFDKLLEYGFINMNKVFILEKTFKEEEFKALIEIKSNGEIYGKVFDLENNDEYLPLRVENIQGAFAGEVRAAYKEVLLEIREKCFTKKYYIFPQSNRITNALIAKYGDEPEFLWETTPGTGVFRNPETGKWYLAILDIDRSKIQVNGKGIVEIADIKLSSEHIENLVQQEHFYPGYHMNKKCWLTIILDDSLPDEKILELIDESYSFTIKKKK